MTAHVQDHDAGEWEDISEESDSVLSPSRSPGSRRRKTNKTTTIGRSPKRIASPMRRMAQAPPSLSSSLMAEKKEKKPTLDFVPDHPNGNIEDKVLSGGSAVLSYLSGVLLRSIMLLRTPLSVLIFLYLLAFVLGLISTAMLQAFCAIPGLSLLPIPMCSLSSDGAGAVKEADYPALMQLQTDAFAALPLTGSSSLSMSMKHVEMASADLKVVVQSSTLRRKDALAEALGKFQEDSKLTSRGLQKFGAMTSGALNQIAAVNDYALDRISACSESSQDRSFLDSAPWPFTTSLSSASDAVILETFVLAMDTLSNELARLILHAQQELMHLDALEEDVSLLHTLLSQAHGPNKQLLSYSDTPGQNQPNAVKELVDRIWKGEKTYNEDKLLGKLDEYRVQAKVHVVRALTTLQGFLDELEDLRERVSQPVLTSPASGSWRWLAWVAGKEEPVDSRTSIPVEVSMKSIQGALEQLKENKVKAREGQKEELASSGFMQGF